MPPTSSPPFLVAIAGGSGSGKSTFTRELIGLFPPGTFALVDLDSYYHSQPGITYENIGTANFDNPDALDFDLLRTHLEELRSGRPIASPVYDFATHLRQPHTKSIHPAPVILVDGVLLLSHPALAASFDLRIFVDAPADLRLIRRLERDLVERGRAVESTLRQYLATVRNQHAEFVEPAKQTAHLVVHNDRPGQAADAIRRLVEFALRLPRLPLRPDQRGFGP